MYGSLPVGFYKSLWIEIVVISIHFYFLFLLMFMTIESPQSVQDGQHFVPMYLKLFPSFSSIRFSLFVFMGRSLIHLELSFVQGNKNGSICNLLHVECQLNTPLCLQGVCSSTITFEISLPVSHKTWDSSISRHNYSIPIIHTKMSPYSTGTLAQLFS